MSITEDRTADTLAVHVEAYRADIERVLITEEEIQAKLAAIGEAITRDYAGKAPLLVGVLKGAFVVMADLSRYIRLPLEFVGTVRSIAPAPCLSNGSFQLPHFGDWTHDGHPAVQPQVSTTSRVAAR